MQHGEPQPAQNNQRHDAGVHAPRPAIRNQALPIQPETGIAECTDRMEHAVKDALAGRPHGRRPHGVQQRRPDRLADKREHHHKPHHPRDPPEHLVTHRILQNQRVTQGKPPARHHPEQAAEHHDAQPAELNQHQNHDLPEPTEITAGVVDHQPRHARGAGGREEAVHHPLGQVMPLFVPVLHAHGPRQIQQASPDQNGRHKGCDHDPGRPQPRTRVAQATSRRVDPQTRDVQHPNDQNVGHQGLEHRNVALGEPRQQQHNAQDDHRRIKPGPFQKQPDPAGRHEADGVMGDEQQDGQRLQGQGQDELNDARKLTVVEPVLQDKREQGGKRRYTRGEGQHPLRADGLV